MRSGPVSSLNGLEDKDGDRQDELHGPSESDLRRYGEDSGFSDPDEDSYLSYRKQEARSALWKLVVAGVAIIFAASMVMNVLLPAFNRANSDDPYIPSAPDRIEATVTRVLDGRTIAVEVDGAEETVRYIGVESPATTNRYFNLAIQANREWTLGQDVMLEADTRDADSEGRLLRYVWLHGAMVNLNLVAAGLSTVSADTANNRYSNLFMQLEESARSQGIGVWGEEHDGKLAILPIVVTVDRTQ